MKNNKIFLLILITFSLLSFQIISALPNTTNTNTTSNIIKTQTQNPIDKFLEQTISSESLKYIGLPTSIAFNQFIVYLLILIVLITIIYEMLDIANMIEKKLINFFISIIITLIGVQQKIVYNMLLPLFSLTDLTSQLNYLNTGMFLLIGIIIIIALRLLKKLFNKIKNDSKQIEIETGADKIKTSLKIQKIQAKAAGIK